VTPSTTARPGAVVIGGDYQGLATARSLGRRGIAVLVLDDEPSIAALSRHVRHRLRVPALRSEQDTVAALRRAAARHRTDGWLLFPTRDETVAAIARRGAELAGLFRLTTPSWAAVRCAWDKRETYRRAAALGVPVPRTWLPAVEGLDAIDGPGPFVVKPAIKEHFFYATGAKAWRADSRSELERRVREASALIGEEEVVVQELVPGGGEAQLAYCCFFKDGASRAAMTVQRLRQHPSEFGRASTYVRTVSDAGLAEPSQRFLRDIGHYGLAELEYKRDSRDGVPKLLDVNPRTWGYHGLGQRAGVDFPAHVYADQLGLPAPDSGRARPGVRWVRLATDLPTAALELARGGLSVRRYAGSLARVDVGGVFSREDPLPALAELALLPYMALSRGL
jgi:D-aspartate ligase